MNKIFLFALGLVFTINSFAQQKNRILLNNAQIETEENIADFYFSQAEVYKGKIARVIQFSEIPSETLLTSIKNSGIELINYIPHFAYYAFLPVSMNADVLKTLGVKTVIKPGIEFKLSKRLYNNDIPEWAIINDSLIEIVVMPYSNVVAEDFISSLNQEEFRILGNKANGKIFEIVCSKSSLQKLIDNHLVFYIAEAEAPAEKENNTAITNHRVNTLNGTNAISTGFTGNGVVVSLGDDGIIGPHIDYKGRLDQSAASNSTGDHGDHVAGTIFGAGNRNPLGRGMAPGAEMIYYTYPANLYAAELDYQTRDVRITSSSYSNGCNAGYTTFTVLMDETSYNNPGLLHVFSAGNSGTSNCSYGAGNLWGNITGGHKVGKNVIAVGNLSRLDAINSSSSRGPAHDGRIKPEVSAVGTSVFSTSDPNTYVVKTGTSMSCPGVSGTLAVLYEAYQTIASKPPVGGLLKAILMNGSDDLGNPGPDFIYGFGRINALKSVKMMEENWIFNDSVTQTSNKTHLIELPSGVKELKIMLYWTDKESFAGSAKALVNDLNLSVQHNSTTYLPLVLNHTPNATLLNQNAVPGIDTINNVEQIVIQNPASGQYVINVNGSVVPFGNQEYFVVYYIENSETKLTYPLGGESFVPNTAEIIRWDAHTPASAFNLQYTTDNGANWINIASNIPTNLRYYSWNVPNIVNGNVKIRLTEGTSVSLSDNFTIMPQVSNLQVISVCPSSATLSWDSIISAQGYVVYLLGQKYMDSVAFTNSNYITLTNINGYTENWYSVAAVANGGGVGRRAIAVSSTGLNNCVADHDLKLVKMISPTSGMIPDCINDSSQVIVEVKNAGTQPISQFLLNYKLNSGNVNSELVNVNLVPGQTYVYTSSTYISFNTQVLNEFQVWVEMTNDQNPSNDSAFVMVKTYNSPILTLPLMWDFQNFTNCATATNCENTVCNLGLGLLNADNLIIDDIDWRVHNGSTASANTGPSVDNTLGTTSGKYIYLEASACFDKRAELYIGCVNLTNAVSPVLEFYHHRFGADIGPLHVEVYHNGKWQELITPINTPSVNLWQKIEVGLQNYVGSIIALRFVGYTTANWAGDIALDDISIKENASLPIAKFNVSNSANCLGTEVGLFDESSKFPTSWEWTISPNTFNFIQGTNANSQNPIVEFTSAGQYDVKLKATNNVGQDSITVLNKISILDFPSPPIVNNSVVQSGGTASLQAFSPHGVRWYASSNLADNNVLDTNSVFLVPNLYLDTSFYVSAVNQTFTLNQLQTTLAMGTGCGSGNMFDVVPTKEDLLISGFTITPRTTMSAMPVSVFYKTGSYVGSETNQNLWTSVGTYYVNAVANIPIYFDCDEFMLSKNQSYGVYVQYDARYTSTTSVQTYSDSLLILTAGAGLCSPFGGVNTPRVFNGRVHYKSGVAVCESNRVEVWALVQSQSQIDAGIVDIVNPAQQSTVNIPVNVEVKIKNFGTDTLFSIPVSYKVNGTNISSEVWTGVLAPDSVTAFVFSNTFTPVSLYNICAFTALQTDQFLFNDTLCKQVNLYFPQFDVAIVEILSPSSETEQGVYVNVSVKVINTGDVNVHNLKFVYDLDSLRVEENWNGILQPTEEINYYFQTGFYPLQGNYVLCASVFHIDDMNSNNDTICKNITDVTSIDFVIVDGFVLGQNVPNPANSKTVIPLYLPKDGTINFQLSNVLGQVLINENSLKQKGKNLIELDINKLKAGIYFYSVEFDNQVIVKKLVVSE